MSATLSQSGRPRVARRRWCTAPGRRTRRAFQRALLGSFVVVAGVAGAARPACAQVSDSLVQRELEYRSATSELQAARDAWSVVERRWSEALDEVGRARRSGDAARLEAALASAQSISLEVRRADGRVRDQESRLADARKALLAALDRRRQVLETRLADATTARERSDLDALIRDLSNQYEEVDQGPDVLRTELVYFPSITYDPRDTPEDLLAKADLLKRKAQAADSTIASIDREIARLEGLLRLQRRRSNFQADLERFGDTQVPVGQTSRRNGRDNEGGAAEPDSTGVPQPQQPLDQRIRELRLFRLQVQGARDQFLRRAEVFQKIVKGAAR